MIRKLVQHFVFAAATAVIGSAQVAKADTGISFLSCQAVNALGTAGIGLGTQGEVIIQTTSVLGYQDGSYSVNAVTRVLENNKGSYLHLVNKDEKQPGVLLVFNREMPGDFSRIDGYLYSVPTTFTPGKDKTPTFPVALVSCTIQFH